MNPHKEYNIGGIIVLVCVLTSCNYSVGRPPITGKSSLSLSPVQESVSIPAAERPTTVDAVYLSGGFPINELVPPEYPPIALSQNVGRVVITMHVVVGPDGRVTNVRPHLQSGVPALIPYYQHFEMAIKRSTAQWRFAPPRLIRFVPNYKGKPPIVEGEPTEVSFNIRFTFDVYPE